MEKACLCGKIRTDEKFPLYCGACFTFTHSVYGERKVFMKSWRDNHMGAVER